MPDKVCRGIVTHCPGGFYGRHVRKHSSARHALVRLGSSASQWNLKLEDDGKGIPFSGRVTKDELDLMGKGPLIIKERVRLIAGTLTVESKSRYGDASGV